MRQGSTLSPGLKSYITPLPSDMLLVMLWHSHLGSWLSHSVCLSSVNRRLCGELAGLD